MPWARDPIWPYPLLPQQAVSPLVRRAHMWYIDQPEASLSTRRGLPVLAKPSPLLPWISLPVSVTSVTGVAYEPSPSTPTWKWWCEPQHFTLLLASTTQHAAFVQLMSAAPVVDSGDTLAASGSISMTAVLGHQL